MNNPFSTTTPENLSVEEVLALFVDIFIDLPQVDQIGHTFIHGTRGSGKTMMFRYMLPEVQLALRRRDKPDSSIQDIRYYGIFLPVKSDLPQVKQISELDSGKTVLAAHYMNLRAIEAILSSLRENSGEILSSTTTPMDFFADFYKKFFRLCDDWGIKYEEPREVLDSFIFSHETISRELITMNRYLGLRELGNEIPYAHALTNFRDFTIPLLKEIKRILPQNIYLMIDDADNLSIELQEVINTWISHRMTDVLSIKVSTQLRYATYRTSSGKIIEVPHDFKEVDLTQVYTSNVGSYLNRVERIVEKRLELAGINVKPYEFFPEDEKQKLEISKQVEIIRERHMKGKGISKRVGDDIYRYAVPEYMTKLQRTKKTNLFSYSGFKTLVNISSGTIRFFLEVAETMYSQMESMTEKEERIEFIPPVVQNNVVKRWSDDFIFIRLPRLNSITYEDHRVFEGLSNLIESLGGLFSRKLLDNSSERRVFSVFVDSIPTEIEEIVQLGISYGYLIKSSIHSKEKTGRKIEIILTRCLSPHFYLDPTGYSGRLSLTEDALVLATKHPKKFIRERLKKSSTADLVDGLFSPSDFAE